MSIDAYHEGGAVVPIGVGRRGVGRDDGTNWRLPRQKTSRWLVLGGPLTVSFVRHRMRAGAPGRYTTSWRVGCSVEVVGLIGSIKLKLFAGLLLRAMAQEQARTGSERVSPRHPGVARRLGLEPDSPELGVAERYLVREDYIKPSGAAREGDSYTITQTGWEDLGYQRSAEGWGRRPWWKRMLGI